MGLEPTTHHTFCKFESRNTLKKAQSNVYRYRDTEHVCLFGTTVCLFTQKKVRVCLKNGACFVYLESVQKGESLRERGALSVGRTNGKVPPLTRWCSLEIGARMFGSKHYKKQVQSCEWPCLLASLVCLQARFGAGRSLCRLSIHLCPVFMLHYILLATPVHTLYTHLETMHAFCGVYTI